MKEETLKVYEDWKFKVSAYEMALSIIGVDKLTVAPSGGDAYRDQRTAYLAGEAFKILSDESMVSVFEEVMNDESLPYDTRKEAKMYLKNLKDTICIPQAEYVAFKNLQNEGYNAWLEAKRTNNYALYAPVLKKLIETQKRLYGYRQSDLSIYDRMLDDFEPGMTTEKYDAFFAKVKERLIPCIQAIKNVKQPDTSFLEAEYPIDKQKAFMDEILAYLHYDAEWGYQNETEHPFTSWTCADDCRTTTKYILDQPVSAILSTIHEVGHAYYRHNIDKKYDGSILSGGVSSGMHESQSRLLENYLGRTKEFWEYVYGKLVSYFPTQLKDVTLDAFYRAINVATPSLVRIEADELTYPLHIVIRYEIEKGLFDGSIDVEHLDQVWDDMYEKYLGVRASKASQGILQDVHWSSGDFGYFPTYALGSAFAAQFMSAMRKDLDVDKVLKEGNFPEIMAWLKSHIHHYGCAKDADEILREVTGESFNPDYYLTYLENKFKNLYNL